MRADDVAIDVRSLPGWKRLQHLDLFIADGVSREVDWRFHRDQAEKLHHVILNHVAQGSGGVVVGTAASGHADLLSDRDLHRADMPAVPDRLEDAVAEPQGENVLNRLLTEIVIDSIDLVFAQDGRDLSIQGAGACEIVAEGLFDDHPAPRGLLLRRVDEPRFAQVANDRSEILG